MNEEALGKRLQLARKRSGLTQQELCHKAGLSYSTLAKIERGAIKSPSVFTVAAIATATQTPLEELLDLPKEAGSPTPAKKRSKTGVVFVYFDINGVLARFHHKAFTEISHQTTIPVDMVETIFWRHDAKVATGSISLDEYNRLMAKEFGVPTFDWESYYMSNVEPMPAMAGLVEWAAEHYEVGLLSNSMPGFIDAMIQRKLIPDVNYKTIVDSSRVGRLKPEPEIFKAAQEMAAVEPGEILLVDDERTSLIEADKLGWHVIWFDDYQPEDSADRIKQALAF